MPDNKYSQRIPGRTWELHKDTILRLYLSEKKPLTASGGVKDIMYIEHGFSATKAQYETRLKKWGFFKYKSAHDRRTQASVLNNHRKEGPETERHTNDPDNNILAETNPFSQNIPIRTSSPHRSALQPSPLSLSSCGISSSTLAGGWHDISVGSVDVQSPVSRREVESIFPQNPTWTSHATLSVHDPFQIRSHTCVNADTTPVVPKDLHDLELLVNSGSLAFSSYAMYAGSFIGGNDSGPPNLNSFLGGFSPRETILSSDFSVPDFATSIMPVISRMVSRTGSIAPMILLGDKSALDHSISNISHPSTSQLIRQLGIDHQFIYMIFHRLVNDGNATRELEDPQTKLDHFFKIGITYCFSLGDDVLTSIVKATPSPYGLALVQNMFRAALILGNGPVLNALMNMNRGIIVNRPVLLKDTQYYPLEFTSRRAHVQATQVLLDHGADPNLQKNGYFLELIGGLPPSQEQDREGRVQIMRLLIGRGLEVNPESATDQMSKCTDKNELFVLATHCLDEYFETFFNRRALLKVVLEPDWDDSFTEILKAILDRASSDGIDDQHVWNSVLSESLSGAVLRSHSSAINILFAMGAIPDISCLISAVLSNDLEIFESFLDRGLDPNAQSPELIFNPPYDYMPDYDRTALSESIKNRSKGAFRILQERGFVSNLAHQPAGFVSAFIAACQIGDSTLIEQLLSLQKFPRRLERIEKALELALEENQYHIINRLLSVGIKPTLRCLGLAVRHKQSTAVKLLASCMNLPDILEANRGNYDSDALTRARLPNKYDNEIIMEALRWGDQTAMEHILRTGHPVDARIELKLSNAQDWNLGPDLQPPGTVGGYWYFTPLCAAILKGNLIAAKALIAHGAHVELFSSRLTSHQSRMVAEAHYRFHGWTLTPLAASAIRDNISLIKEFLSKGADPFDNTALFVCAALDLEDVTTLLLSAFKNRYPDGAESFGSDALYLSIKRENMRLLRLFAKDTDIAAPVVIGDHKWYDYSFTSPLGEAIRLHSAGGGSSGVLELLLPLVKDLNAVAHKDEKHGVMTPLLYAIFLGSLETVQKLHQAGADISLPAEWQIPRTPLQAAAEAGSKDILEYLLREGVNPNEPPATRAGATALQLAAITGNIGIVTVLLDAGADINAPPAFCDGRTAFEGATEHGRIEMMMFLVSCGADLLSNDNEQYRRAVEFAEDNSQHAAREVADDLYGKALADQGMNSIGMGGDGWSGPDMGRLGDLIF